MSTRHTTSDRALRQTRSDRPEETATARAPRRKAPIHEATAIRACLNNNIFCTSEKETIVVEEVASSLIKFIQDTGRAYLLNRAEADRVIELVVTREGKINKAYIGKNVQVILADVGISVGDDARGWLLPRPPSGEVQECRRRRKRSPGYRARRQQQRVIVEFLG